MIVSVYIDESGTHSNSPVMTMAGYIAKLGQWQIFDAKWQKMLRREGLTYFHATEIWHGSGDWNGWTDERKIAFVMRSEKICQDHTLCGFSVVLTEADYKQFYLADQRPKRIPLDTMYGLCFRLCASFLPDMIRRSLGGDDIKINFILESGHKHSGDAERVFRQLQKVNIPEISPHLAMLSMGKKKQFPGLQAADALAFTTFKMEQGEVKFTPYPPELTAQEAARLLGRKSPAFRLKATPEILSELKDNILALSEARKQFASMNQKLDSDNQSATELSATRQPT